MDALLYNKYYTMGFENIRTDSFSLTNPNFSVVNTPEPGTWSLGVAGAILMIVSRVWRKAIRPLP